MRIKNLIDKLIRDFFNPLKYKLTEDYSSEMLGEYYFVFNEEDLLKGGTYPFSFDDNGIPIISKKGKDHSEKCYYPMAIAQYGLAIFHKYLITKKNEDKDRFIKIVNWFEKNQNTNGFWEINAPDKNFQLKPGWVSAMGQGRGISILLRGYQLTQNTKYLESAKLALDTFNILTDNNGITGFYKDNIFYEEYPSEPLNHVLNGMIFALYGIYDYIRVTKNDLAKKIFDDGISSLKAMLPLYDTGFWTTYDLWHLESNKAINPATAHYHNIHIKQIMSLYKITKDDYFLKIAQKWQQYENNKINLCRAYWLKYKVIKKRK